MSNDFALQGVNLVKYFPTGASRFLGRPTNSVRAVDGVSFSVRAGATLGIVGESGCGKSTLARVATRLIEPTSGSVLLDGEDITNAKGTALQHARRKMQMIFQDPYSSLNPRHSVGQIIGAPLQVQKITPPQGEKVRVQELMQLVGLNPEHYNRYPHEFSGGQRQRIGIARSLVLNPSIIVADEPVSALDVSIQAQILNLLDGLQKDLGLSYVFIAHDLSVVRHIADDVAVMYLGKIVESGPAEVVYQSPSHPYTKALLSAVPVANPQRRGDHERIRLAGDVPSPIDPPSGCRFRTRCWLATDLCAAQEPELVQDAQGRSVACHFPSNQFRPPHRAGSGDKGIPVRTVVLYITVVLNVVSMLSLIVGVLLHSGQGGGLSDMFGGASGAGLGSAAAEKNLNRITTVFATVWLFTVVALAFLLSN